MMALEILGLAALVWIASGCFTYWNHHRLLKRQAERLRQLGLHGD